MQPTTHPATSQSPDLLGVLRLRQSQAEDARDCHAHAVASPDAMLYWLAAAAKELREAAGRKQVHIAAEADRDQSTIYRFESAEGWPRITDRIVAAYAADLDITPLDIWQLALQRWSEHQAKSPTELAAWEAQRTAQRTRGRRPANGTKNRVQRPGSRGR